MKVKKLRMRKKKERRSQAAPLDSRRKESTERFS